MSDNISNGTVFGRWPLSRSVPIVAMVLVVFFVIVKPEASQGLGFVERTVFWIIHVGIGMLGLLGASLLLMPRYMSRLSPLVAVLLSGLAGALVTVPVFFLVESTLPPSLQAEELSPLDVFAREGIWQGLLVEFLDAAPVVLATWLAINLPLLIGRPELLTSDTDDESESAALAEEARTRRQEFLERLPATVGVDVLAVSSDLHYLHVHTAIGSCMIHGSMRDAVESLGDAGLQVHRSHWVARHGVDRVVRNSGQTYCLLKNSLRIPVSRRNRAVVQEWFGSNAKVHSLGVSPKRQVRPDPK